MVYIFIGEIERREACERWERGDVEAKMGE